MVGHQQWRRLYRKACSRRSTVLVSPKQASDLHNADGRFLVRQVILTPEDGIKQLPRLFNKAQSRSVAEGAPQQDLDRPVAVITGAAYSDEEVLQLQASCGKEELAGVYWLRAGQRSDMPPPGPAYGARMAERVKELMMRLKREEKLGKAEPGEQVEF